MAGSKTRFGFSGTSEPAPSKGRDPDGSRAARTFIGHETHRPGEKVAPVERPNIEVHGTFPPPDFVPGCPEPAVPETVLQEELTERVTDRKGHTGKSKVPAIARLFGRWTTGGGFLSRSRVLASDETLPELPRNVWPARIAIFLGAALISFLIALAVIKVAHLE